MITKVDIKERTKQLTLLCFYLCNEFPNRSEFWIIKNQIIRSISSIGANYAEALGSRTKQEFISKLQIVLSETYESIYWIEIIEKIDTINPTSTTQIKKELIEIKKIISSSIITSKKRYKVKK